jgi:hypothetical protein
MKMGGILKWGLIAGGAYLAYRSGIFSAFGLAPAADATAGTVTGGGGTTSTAATTTTPPANTQYVAPGTLQLLKNAAAAVLLTRNTNKLNADEWGYYYNQLPGKSIPSATADSLFWPNGRPATTAEYPLFTAEDYLAALTTKGLSGLGCMNFTPLLWIGGVLLALWWFDKKRVRA